MNGSPFGELSMANDGDRQPLRFSDKYADGEAGFSYKYFKDYDSSLGRFIQSDPIGLAGASIGLVKLWGGLLG